MRRPLSLRYLFPGDQPHNWVLVRRSLLNLARALPAFRPNSGGRYDALADLTLQAANRTLPALADLAAQAGAEGPARTDIAGFTARFPPRDTDALGDLFTRHGSDKADPHGYHPVYAALLERIRGRKTPTIVEVGLGSPHPDTPSHMGPNGQPGASLRAFRDWMPNARIYGADIDRRILFAEDRIETCFADQCAPGGFNELDALLPPKVDLMIDDGLHAPDANLNTLSFFLKHSAPGSAIVIEDIPVHAVALWDVVGALMPDRFERFLVEADRDFLFVCIEGPSDGPEPPATIPQA